MRSLVGGAGWRAAPRWRQMRCASSSGRCCLRRQPSGGVARAGQQAHGRTALQCALSSCSSHMPCAPHRNSGSAAARSSEAPHPLAPSSWRACCSTEAQNAAVARCCSGAGDCRPHPRERGRATFNCASQGEWFEAGPPAAASAASEVSLWQRRGGQASASSLALVLVVGGSLLAALAAAAASASSSLPASRM